MKRAHIPLLALALLVALLSLVYADSDTGAAANVQPTAVAVGYLPTSTTGNYRSTLSAGDNANLDAVSVATVQTLSCGGKTTLAVTGFFSASAATSAIEVVRYRSTEVRGYSVGTLTAVTSAPTTGGLYPSATLYFDTANADYVKVLLRGNPSSGSVSLRVEAY